jgi:polyhydroxybutyrate depolymerase
MRSRIALALMAVGILAGSATAPAAVHSGPVTMHWTIDGVQRSALVFAPAPTTTVGVLHPLVFVFHGHGGNAAGAAQLFHIQTLWPQAVVVVPQGLPTPAPIDPAGTKPGWQLKAGDENDRDLKLFDAMVATMKHDYAIAPRRIYTTGFSNGGVFSYLLWAERGKVIAAVAEVAGRLDDAETLTLPRALLAIAGRNDTTDLFANQVASIDKAKQVNGATGPGVPCGPICRIYPSPGGNKTPVKTLIHNGGHVVPPWAPAQIVKFLRAHAQP